MPGSNCKGRTKPESPIKMAKKKVYLQYFAQLREWAGHEHEICSTDAETLSQLFDEIKNKYSLPLEMKDLRVAVNDEFTEWGYKLSGEETIVFIPPVAGG